MKRKLLGAIALALTCAAGSAPAAFDFGLGNPVERVANAITEIDTQRATELLQHSQVDSIGLTLERARLAVYLGECDRAEAILSNPLLADSREGASLAELAKSCARATCGPVSCWKTSSAASGCDCKMTRTGRVAPFIFEVAAQARDTVSKEVGIDLPRPLRIDLVRDLFSLSAVSGLPLKAAETTGTLAVARWGRVIMLLAARAGAGLPLGKTLWHTRSRICLVTRATRDFAPLWLQEGLAKRFEVRWRPARPFDRPEWAGHGRAQCGARWALGRYRQARAIDRDGCRPRKPLGPPSPRSRASCTSSSFRTANPRCACYSRTCGAMARRREAALLSVTGYGLSEWNARWQRFLREPLKPSAETPLHASRASCTRRRRATHSTRGLAGRSRSRARVRERSRAAAELAGSATSGPGSRGFRFVRGG